MSVKWFAPGGAATKVKVDLGDVRFEASGDAAMVERALASFLEKHGNRPNLASKPEPMSNEGSTTVRVRRPLRASFIRLHAINGEIAKIYPLDIRRLKSGMLARLVNLDTIRNIYIESSALSEQLKGDHKTLWHALMPNTVSGSGASR